MNKISIIVIGAITVLLIVFLILFFYTPPVRNNENFDEEINRIIQESVDEMLQVYYGRFDRERLESILSEELLYEVEVADRFRRFREERSFYRVDPNYMQTLQRTDVNELGEEFFHVRVRVYETLFSNNHLIHNLTIKRRLDNSSIIIFIEYDR